MQDLREILSDPCGDLRYHREPHHREPPRREPPRAAPPRTIARRTAANRTTANRTTANRTAANHRAPHRREPPRAAPPRTIARRTAANRTTARRKVAHRSTSLHRAHMIITVGHEKGGCGKTTTATNVAVWLARHGADVMLLDADRQRSASFWAAVRAASPNLPAVRCVQATGNISATIRDLAQRYQHVVIDCGGLDSVELRSALLVSQRLIVPLRPSQFDLWSLAHLAEIVAAAQALNPNLRADVVLSLVPTNSRVREGEEARSEVTKHENLHLLAHQLCDRKAYRDAVRGGWGVIEMDDVKAADEIAALAEEIYGQVSTRSLAVA